jgi:5-oxoprolinase (ATP-hydrolysing) subunit C
MDGLIAIIAGGIGNSIQDEGRFGFRHMGITVSGCLDPLLARCANALVGNPPECACIEIRAVAPTLQVKRGRVRLALAGAIGARLRRVDGTTADVPAWTSFTLDLQEVLEINPLSGGSAYLAAGGGIASPLQLGSRSTYQRALIGGIDGRPIVNGNVLPCEAQAHRQCRQNQAAAWSHGEDPIRVMLGPQAGHFKPEAVQAFLASEYRVTTQMDRMGVRLEGPALAHLRPEAADIVSDGVTPGAIQVPGNGQPIILLADCQTVGGYPKIATVISADMPRLGQIRPEERIRFAAVGAAAARQALLEREAQWRAWADRISPVMPDMSLLDHELNDGWISADS